MEGRGREKRRQRDEGERENRGKEERKGEKEGNRGVNRVRINNKSKKRFYRSTWKKNDRQKREVKTDKKDLPRWMQ